MVITIELDLETALKERARQEGLAPEVLAINALRDRFLGRSTLVEPRDDWERGLRQIATDCGVSVPDSALSSEGLYE